MGRNALDCYASTTRARLGDRGALDVGNGRQTRHTVDGPFSVHDTAMAVLRDRLLCWLDRLTKKSELLCSGTNTEGVRLWLKLRGRAPRHTCKTPPENLLWW